MFMSKHIVAKRLLIHRVQLTTSYTDFFVVAKMSVDLVGFVNLVGVGTIPMLSGQQDSVEH